MKRILLATGAIALAACGDSGTDGGDGPSGDVGSCTASPTSCTELRGGNAGAFSDECDAQGLTGGDGCSITPKVGCCTQGAASNCYYGDDYASSAMLLESTCTAASGTWAGG